MKNSTNIPVWNNWSTNQTRLSKVVYEVQKMKDQLMTINYQPETMKNQLQSIAGFRRIQQGK